MTRPGSLAGFLVWKGPSSASELARPSPLDRPYPPAQFSDGSVFCVTYGEIVTCGIKRYWRFEFCSPRHTVLSFNFSRREMHERAALRAYSRTFILSRSNRNWFMGASSAPFLPNPVRHFLFEFGTAPRVRKIPWLTASLEQTPCRRNSCFRRQFPKRCPESMQSQEQVARPGNQIMVWVS